MNDFNIINLVSKINCTIGAVIESDTNANLSESRILILDEGIGFGRIPNQYRTMNVLCPFECKGMWQSKINPCYGLGQSGIAQNTYEGKQ